MTHRRRRLEHRRQLLRLAIHHHLHSRLCLLSTAAKMFRTAPRMAGYVVHVPFPAVPAQLQRLRGDHAIVRAVSQLN